MEQLKWLVGDYMAKLNELCNSGHSALNKKTIKDIFSNVEIILNFHSDFLLSQIEQRLSTWNNETTLLGDIFGSRCGHFIFDLAPLLARPVLAPVFVLEPRHLPVLFVGRLLHHPFDPPLTPRPRTTPSA